MSSLTLVIGNKNYSSWSLRPWILMKQFSIPFSEIVIPLFQDDTEGKILTHSPAGRAPILKDGNVTVWDTIAIAEYLNEKFPDKELWPKNPEARALARSVSAEMHSSFMDLRNQCPMNVRRKPAPLALTEGTQDDVRRIQDIWNDARARFGQGGPFLFGKFSIADAMYAPVVFRFTRYAIPMNEACRAYANSMLDLPAMKEWIAAGEKESWSIPANDR